MPTPRALGVSLLTVLALSAPGVALAAGPAAADPPAPTVSSPQYPDGTWSPPRAGVVRFGPNGVADVVAYQYSYQDDYRTLSVPAVDGVARVPFTPTTLGPLSLFVHSVTRSGAVSDARRYLLMVSGHGGPVATWQFDEAAAATAAVDDVSGRSARLTGAAQFRPGTGPSAYERPDDGALGLGTEGDGARTRGPLIDTSSAFTLTAWVRLADLTAESGPAEDRTIASEDGRVRPAMWLGYDADALADDDPTTRNGTFVLRMRTADTYGAQVVQVQAGREQLSAALHTAAGNSDGYIGVAARYDGAGTLDLFLDGLPAGPSAHLRRDWRATGDFRLGSGHSDGRSASLGGDLDRVSVYAGALFDVEVVAALEP